MAKLNNFMDHASGAGSEKVLSEIETLADNVNDDFSAASDALKQKQPSFRSLGKLPGVLAAPIHPTAEKYAKLTKDEANEIAEEFIIKTPNDLESQNIAKDIDSLAQKLQSELNDKVSDLIDNIPSSFKTPYRVASLKGFKQNSKAPMTPATPQAAKTINIVKAPNRKTLSHGAFVGTDPTGNNLVKKGPSCRFVYVSDGWDPDTPEDYLPTLFNAMGIPVPSVSFVTDRCTNLIPEAGLRLASPGGPEEITFGYKPSNNPDRMELVEVNPTQEEKDFFEIIMRARISAIMKAISTACVQCEGMYYLQDPYADNSFDALILDNLTPGNVVLTSFSLQSPVIQPMKELIIDSVVNMSDDVTTGVQWGLGRPENDASSAMEDGEPHQEQCHDVLTNITHIIVFETEQDHQFFQKAMAKEIPQALCAAGGTMALLESALVAIEQGTPLFIFNHTVRTGYLLARLMKFQHETDPSRHDELKRALFEDDKRKLYDLADDMPSKVLQAAYNFPITYNPNSVFVIDPLRERNPDKLLDKISNVISSVYDSVPELGGTMAENRMFSQAIVMERQLAVLMRNEVFTANLLKAIMIILTFVTTAIACLIEQIRNEAGEDKSLPLLSILTIVLPILLGICATCFASFSPVSRSAMFTLVHARLTQEMYKYRCRVGDYRARSGLGPAHRVAFSNRLKAMWDDIMNSEVMKGSLDIDSKIHPESSVHLKQDNDSKNMFPALRKKPKPGLFELHPLTSEQYIKERLETMLESFRKEIPALSRYIRVLQVGAIIASSAGALLAVYEFQLWMPTLLSFVTVLESITEYNKLPLKLRTMNITYSKLKQVMFWWSGLTLIQQRMPQNKFRLVSTVEALLYDQISVLLEGDLESKDDVGFDEDGEEAEKTPPTSGSSSSNKTQSATKSASAPPK